MVVTIPFKLAANNVLLLKYFNKGRFLAASRCSKIVSSFQNYNLNMQSSTAENWAPCACTFDLASAGAGDDRQSILRTRHARFQPKIF